MNDAYLQRVLTYLRQELPENYRDNILLSGEKLIIHTLEPTVNFDQVSGTLEHLITAHINRIRNREIDLNFTIKAENQQRDFKVLK